MPTSLIIGAAVAGAATASYGTYEQQRAAEKQNEAQQQQIAEEKKQEAIRKQAMELDAQRKQMENLRQVQRARSMAIATAGAQGGLFGSGLQGGFGQIQGQGAWNTAGINASVDFGRQMFASNQNLSDARMAYANASTDMATAQGLTSLGGTILSAAGTIGNLAGNFYGTGTPKPRGIVGTSSIYSKYG